MMATQARWDFVPQLEEHFEEPANWCNHFISALEARRWLPNSRSSKLPEVLCWEAISCVPAGSSKLLCYSSLPYIYDGFVTICWIIWENYQGSLPLYLLDVASFHGWCLLPTHWQYYVSAFTTFTSSIAFSLGVLKCIGLPCVLHDLLELCKTWLSTCRCGCMVPVDVDVYRVKVSNVGRISHQRVHWILLPQTTQL